MTASLHRSFGSEKPGSGRETMQLVDGTMITSEEMPLSVGVGDAIVWNDGSDQLAFIHQRASSTVFTVRDNNGGIPDLATGGQSFSVYRCSDRVVFGTTQKYPQPSVPHSPD